MLDKINMLRDKLERQVVENKPYEEVLQTSRQIDLLLVEYYNAMINIDVRWLALIKQD